jgi:hypothetical protein
MPGFDRGGPAGQGPGAGWGRGLCFSQAGGRRFSLTGALWGVGPGGTPWGGGRGRCFGGRGRRLWPSWDIAPVSPSDEAEALKARLSAAKQEIAAMEARLSQLDKIES